MEHRQISDFLYPPVHQYGVKTLYSLKSGQYRECLAVGAEKTPLLYWTQRPAASDILSVTPPSLT